MSAGDRRCSRPLSPQGDIEDFRQRSDANLWVHSAGVPDHHSISSGVESWLNWRGVGSCLVAQVVHIFADGDFNLIRASEARERTVTTRSGNRSSEQFRPETCPSSDLEIWGSIPHNTHATSL